MTLLSIGVHANVIADGITSNENVFVSSSAILSASLKNVLSSAKKKRVSRKKKSDCSYSMEISADAVGPIHSSY